MRPDDRLGPGAGGKPGDEVAELRDFLLALRVVGLDPRSYLRLGQHHVVVPAGVRDDRLVVDVGDVGAHGVHEVAVVGDDDENTGIAKEKIPKPVDGVQVKMVGRLIQQEHVGGAEEGLGQEHPDLLAPLQLGHGPLVQGIGNVQALQQDGGVAVSRVAVFLAHDTFELAQAHAVGFAHVGFGVEDLALFERLPQALVAHDHGVGHPDVVEGELVLG